MSTEESEHAKYGKDIPFVYDRIRNALDHQSEDGGRYRRQAVLESAWRVHILLGIIGDLAREKARENQRETVKEVDLIDAWDEYLIQYPD